jgi:hypothetical protein
LTLALSGPVFILFPEFPAHVYLLQ